jgi:hypothetical protein
MQPAAITTPRPNALVLPLALAGMVLHWAQASYAFTRGGPDPANRYEMTGDIWVEIGPNGGVRRFHGVYRYANGGFHQQIVQTQTRR